MCFSSFIICKRNPPTVFFLPQGDGALLCRNLVGGEDYLWQMLFVKPEGRSFVVLRFNSLS